MNRRDLLKTAALPLLIPSWLLPRSLRAEAIDLSLFCANDEWSRYSMTKPFRQSGHVYATDARIAIRVGGHVGCEFAGEEAKLPPVDTLRWWPDADSAGWQSITNRVRMGDARGSDCSECYGTGRVGAGIVSCECEYLEFCRFNGAKCRGWRGGSRCGLCEGTGTVDWRWKIGDGYYAPAYIAKLETLPGVEVCSGGELENQLGVAPVLVARFDGGVGVLCPMNPRPKGTS